MAREVSLAVLLLAALACGGLPPLPDTSAPTVGSVAVMPSETARPMTVTVTVTAEVLTLRPGPSEQGGLGYLRRGDRLTVLGSVWVGEDCWLRVDGGWVAALFDGAPYVTPLDVCKEA